MVASAAKAYVPLRSRHGDPPRGQALSQPPQGNSGEQSKLHSCPDPADFGAQGRQQTKQMRCAAIWMLTNARGKTKWGRERGEFAI